MPDVHARFSPSSADRYIHCPPSLLLGEEVGPADTSTDYTREGTEAHALGEYLLRTELGETMADPRPTFHYYNEEMQSWKSITACNVIARMPFYPSSRGLIFPNMWRMASEPQTPLSLEIGIYSLSITSTEKA